MEKQIAIVRKSDGRVENILVVDSLEKSHIEQWATDTVDVVPIKDSIPYVHGLWDGKTFSQPENAYLKSIGLLSDPIEETPAE
jgi:hypothetical protein